MCRSVIILFMKLFKAIPQTNIEQFRLSALRIDVLIQQSRLQQSSEREIYVRIYPQETMFDNTQRNRMDQQVNSQWHPCQDIISYCTKCCFCTLYFLAVIIVRTSIFIFFSLTKTPLIKYNDLFYSVVLTSSFIDTDHVWII